MASAVYKATPYMKIRRRLTTTRYGPCPILVCFEAKHALISGKAGAISQHILSAVDGQENFVRHWCFNPGIRHRGRQT